VGEVGIVVEREIVAAEQEEAVHADTPEADVAREEREAVRLAFPEAVGDDPELDVIKERYHDEVSAHRATVARWIAQAREAILDEARRRLEARLRFSPTELQRAHPPRSPRPPRPQSAPPSSGARKLAVVPLQRAIADGIAAEAGTGSPF
jgi:hypothetical protein